MFPDWRIFCLVLIAAGVCRPSRAAGPMPASRPRAALVFRQSAPLEGLTWESKEFSAPKAASRTGVLRGRFSRPGWTLYTRDASLYRRSPQEFRIRVALGAYVTKFELVAIGPGGETEERTVTLVLTDPRRKSKGYETVREVASLRPVSGDTEIVENEAPRVRGALQMLVTPTLSYFQLQVTDLLGGGTASFNSGLTPGIRARGVPYSTTRYSLFAELGASSASVQSPTGAFFQSDTFLAWTFHAGIDAFPFPIPLTVSAVAGFRKLPIVRAVDNAGTLTLDSRTTPEVGLRAGYDIYREAAFRAGLEGTISLLFGAQGTDYTVSDGTALSLCAYATRDVAWGSLRGSVGYFRRSFRTVGTTGATTSAQAMNEIGIELGVGFRLF